LNPLESRFWSDIFFFSRLRHIVMLFLDPLIRAIFLLFSA
jgi:hypothetical protein